MKKHLLEHIRILKTDPILKKDIEKLRHWTYIEHKNWHIFRVWEWCDENQRIRNNINVWLMKRIWQIHEWYLRMFFSKNKWAFAISSEWKMIWNKNKEWSYFELQLDNTKPYSEQSESFFKKLNEWLMSKFNIKL